MHGIYNFIKDTLSDMFGRLYVEVFSVAVEVGGQPGRPRAGDTSALCTAAPLTSQSHDLSDSSC